MYMVRDCGKKTKIKYENKEMQDSLQLISNDVSIQAELGLNIVEIYVDQHSKS